MMAVPRSGKFFKLLQYQLDEMKGNPLVVFHQLTLFIITSHVIFIIFCSALFEPKRETLDSWLAKLGQFFA